MRREIRCGILLLVLSSPAALADELTSDNGLVVYETADKAFRLRAGGLVQLDAVTFDGDDRFADMVRFRRFRANLVADLHKDWHLKAEYEFDWPGFMHSAFPPLSTQGWRNLWLSYTGFSRTRITLGNQSAPVGLENVISSADTTLLERSASNAFVSRYYLGASVRIYGHDWTARAGVYRESISSRHDDPNRGTTVAGRVTWTPLIDDDEVVHLGLDLSHFDLAPGSLFQIEARPLVGISVFHLVNTGALTDVASTNLVSLEAAWSRGPFRLQAEYIYTALRRPIRPDPVFGGGYLQASWIVTGESYRYSRSNGDFDGIEPKSQDGAIEVAARVGTMDLQDKTVTGGRQSDVTIGVNWYPNSMLRLGANYIWANAVPNSAGTHETLRAAVLRAQVSL